MAEYKLQVTNARPFFAELPYYVWGQVNYDSEGDCKNPLDRDWTWMELTHRETDEHIDISSHESTWSIKGADPAAARLARFMKERCDGTYDGAAPETHDWDHHAGMARAAKVAQNFENECLLPFAKGHLFWGSWKWVGWFGTQFTWVGRWIMDSVVRNDTRGVNLCIEWLRDGTFNDTQSEALRYALQRLTGYSHATHSEWLQWYDSGGSKTYPEPDFDEWYSDLQSIHGE